MSKELIVVLNNGGDTAAIAKCVRDLGLYCEIQDDVLYKPYLKGVIVAWESGSQKDDLPDVDVPFFHVTRIDEHLSEDIKSFCFRICECRTSFSMDQFIESSIAGIKNTVGDKKVLLALSGGTDSAVCAMLIHKAIGKNLTCIFVDHGLMRKGEPAMIEEIFKKTYDINLIMVDAKQRYYDLLRGVTDPEQKRKIIGNEFIRVFEEEASKLGQIDYLAQGTIYPDVIESESSSLIKSHHNVGGLPERTDFKGYIEPLRSLFKPEVRECGRALGLPEEITERQPFPGPGLGVRVIGEITAEKIRILQDADFIFRSEIESAQFKRPGQYFAVLTDMRSVGIRDGKRTYGYTLALRAVNSTDFMTGTIAEIPYELLNRIVNRITDEVVEIGRAVYDVTGKPPGTVEWE